jgi:hypothetical protein
LPWLHRNLLPTRTPLPTTRRHVPFAGTATHALYVVLGDDATLADVYAAAQSAQQSVLLVVRGERPREAIERLLTRWAAAAKPGHGAAEHDVLEDDDDDDGAVETSATAAAATGSGEDDSVIMQT